MVKCSDCESAKRIAAGDQWYCELTGDDSGRGPGDNEIRIDGVKYERIWKADEELRCDHFDPRQNEE